MNNLVISFFPYLSLERLLSVADRTTIGGGFPAMRSVRAGEHCTRNTYPLTCTGTQ